MLNLRFYFFSILYSSINPVKRKGTSFAMGWSKTDSFLFFSEIISLFESNKLIKNTMILNTNAILKTPKTIPANLLINPKEARLKALSMILAERCTKTTTAIKVVKKASIPAYLPFKPILSPTYTEKRYAKYIPNISASKLASSIANPFTKPL